MAVNFIVEDVLVGIILERDGLGCIVLLSWLDVCPSFSVFLEETIQILIYYFPVSAHPLFPILLPKRHLRCE